MTRLKCSISVENFNPRARLVSHYSAICNTISCDAPYSGIVFRGKFFCDARLVRPVFGTAIVDFKERSVGVAAIVCDTTGNTVRQGYCYTCLAIAGGGYFGRVTKGEALGGRS